MKPRSAGIIFIVLAYGTLLLPAQPSQQSPINLVGNGSFESYSVNPNVDISPWRWSGCMMFYVNEGWRAVSGTNYPQVCGRLYQDIATIPGQTYQFLFAFGGHEQEQSNKGPLHVVWGGQDITTIPITPVPARSPQWHYLSFNAIAAGETTRIGFYSAPEAFPYIDDVSVIAVPEPSVLSLLAFAGLGWMGVSWVRRRLL